MLLKGMLFGVVVAIISLVIYVRSLMAFAAKVAPGATSIDIRGLEQSCVLFFGGMGIGIGTVTALIFGVGYAMRLFAHHMAGL